MLNLVQKLQPLTERLHRTVIERFQDYSRLLRSGVSTGLKPSLLAGRAGVLDIDYSGGDCYVDEIKYTIAAGSLTLPSSTTTYVWVDNTGVLQTGTAWPGTVHCKLFGAVTDNSITTHFLMDEVTYRDSLLGFDAERNAIVLPPSGNAGVISNLYYVLHPGSGNRESNGFGQCFTVKRPILIESVDLRFESVLADVVNTMRGGVWDFNTEDWLAYSDRDLSAGLDYGTGDWLTFQFPPYLLMPGNYVFGCGTIARGASWTAPAFGALRHDQYNYDLLPDEGQEYCAPSYYQTTVDNVGDEGAFLWDDVAGKFRKDAPVNGISSSQMTWRIRGRQAAIGYVKIEDTLAAAPSRFLGSANTRARDTETGVYSASDPDTQPAEFSISLDGGAHFTKVVEAEELTTIYSGTDFIGILMPVNDNALELEMNAAGFFYET